VDQTAQKVKQNRTSPIGKDRLQDAGLVVLCPR